MKLIINADDFGMTLNISSGIIFGLKEGIITDTSAMVTSDYFDRSVELAKKAEIKSMGVHLNITQLKPLSRIEDVSSIVDDKGDFYKNPDFIPIGYKHSEVEKELRTQIEKFLKTGLKLDHLDVHHGFNNMDEEIYKLVITLASEYNVPLRRNTDKFSMWLDKKVKMPDYFCKGFYGHGATIEELKKIIFKYKDYEGTLEIMSHPGFCDEELMKLSSYNIQRRKELDVFTSAEIKTFIEDNKINLINYSLL
jgi:predicted glycoside hydrolase/deacetylase ChbG (UPF0249 family)